MRKIKICHVIGNFINGGVESVIYNYFSHMDLSRFEVTIIGHGAPVKECEKKFTDLGFRIYNITPKRISFFSNINDMNEIFKKERFDIVHSHLTDAAFVPMILAWKNGVKVRVNHSHMAEYHSGFLSNARFRFYKVLGKAFATDYFACGEKAAEYLFGEHCVRDEKVHILDNAIDLSQFRYDAAVRKQIRLELKIPDTTLCIGHVGRFFEQKNHRFLLDIFYTIHQEYPESVLLLLGDGELMQEIKSKTEERHLQDSVYFLGVRQNISPYYQAMDVLLLPSLFEGLPVVGIEAQSAGLPCVFSDKITKEIAITDDVELLSLERPLSDWVATVLSYKAHTRNTVTNRRMNQYDIHLRAHELESFYLTACHIPCEQ